MSHLESAPYEVHIVGYEGTDLSSAPKEIDGLFCNDIALSTQGFSQIATWEGKDPTEAHQAFEAARAWSAKVFADPTKPGVHVKLEVLSKEQCFKEMNPFVANKFQRRNHSFEYVSCAYTSAWDIHFDGVFDPELRALLHEDGGIILDYHNSDGTDETTITWHFLEPSVALKEFDRLQKLVLACGGFKGVLYTEHPLAFSVYGDTIPRPVIIR